MGTTTISVYGVDNFTAQMGNYFLGEYNEKKFATGDYVIAFALPDNGEESIHYEIGDEITIADKTYELMAIMEPKETIKGMVHSPNNKLEIDYAISSLEFENTFPDVMASSLFIDTIDHESNNSVYESLEAKYPNMTIVTSLTYESRFKEQILAQVVMGYTLGVVMALIGILNFTNAILIAIVSRRREFAMLESVGMTKRQLKKMLVFEGLNYASLSLLMAIVLSVITGFLFIQEIVSTSWTAAFNFSLLPFLIIIPILIILSVLIPLQSFNNTQRKSLVERLRETSFN